MLKACFVGFGRMGITHFSILNSNPLVDICGVCDKSSTMMNIMKRYLHIKTYSDYRRMIDEIKPDFVIISTPANSHSEIIYYALEKNIHIFCEKPFCLTTDQGREIIQYLNDRSIVNQIGYVNRFNEIFMEVKRLIEKGIIGEIMQYSSEMYGATVLKDTKSSWRGKRNLGGGCMYEFASHCIDLAIYLLGKPDSLKGSHMKSIYSSQVEDLVSSTFIHKNGYSGNIFVNWSDAAFRKPTNIITICGTNGKIIADKHAYKIFLRSGGENEGFHPGWNTRYITDFAKSVRYYVRGNEFTRQLDYFIDCIKENKKENICSFGEALKTDEMMETIIQDAMISQNDRIKDNFRNQNKGNSDVRPRFGKRIANLIKGTKYAR